MKTALWFLCALFALLLHPTAVQAQVSERAPEVMTASPESPADAAWWRNVFETGVDHVKDTWTQGKVEAYVPFSTFHMPFAYTPDQRANYTEDPNGFGLGLGRYNASGNYEGTYAMVFQDSHGQPEYMVGYAWIPTWPLGDTALKVGVGVVAFLTSRADTANYTPFPGILPVASLSIANLSIQTSYVPGGNGWGNVLFTWAKWSFE